MHAVEHQRHQVRLYTDKDGRTAFLRNGKYDVNIVL